MYLSICILKKWVKIADLRSANPGLQNRHKKLNPLKVFEFGMLGTWAVGVILT